MELKYPLTLGGPVNRSLSSNRGGHMLRRIGLLVYMMRIPMFILIVLGVVLPLAFDTAMFRGLADLEPYQVWIVTVGAFMVLSAAMTCAFLVLLYGSDRADGSRRAIASPPSQSPSKSLPPKWVVSALY